MSRLDGSGARVLISAIPPFDRYGDNTSVDGISWSPDGKSIALETERGIGHGDTDARIFIVPSGGGRLRKFIDCGGTGRAPVWTEDGKALYIVRYSDDSRPSYLRADIASGSLAPIAKEEVPKLPGFPLPEGAGQPFVDRAGRFLYYEAPVERKPQLVRVEGLVAK